MIRAGGLVIHNSFKKAKPPVETGGVLRLLAI